MADEDAGAVDDGQELAQESAADATQLEAVETDLTADGADDGAAAEGDLTAAVVTGDPDTIDALWERYPALREQHERDQEEKLRERENAGANRERARLQREAGKEQSVRQRMAQLAQRWDEMTPDERERDAGFTYSLAAANAAHELATAVPDSLLKNHAVPVAVREAALEARERGDWDGFVSTLFTGAVDAEVSKQRAGDEAKNTTEVNRRVAAEMKTRGIEKAPVREGQPVRPGGGAVATGITAAELEAMPNSVFLAKPIEEQQRLVEQARTNSARLAGVAR